MRVWYEYDALRRIVKYGILGKVCLPGDVNLRGFGAENWKLINFPE